MMFFFNMNNIPPLPVSWLGLLLPTMATVTSTATASTPTTTRSTTPPCHRWVVVVDVNNLKNGRKPVKLQKESPAGCAGEGKQSKGN